MLVRALLVVGVVVVVVVVVAVDVLVGTVVSYAAIWKSILLTFD